MVEELAPRWPWVMFGDGQQAQIINSVDLGADRTGRKRVKLYLRPSEDLMTKYRIDNSELHEIPGSRGISVLERIYDKVYVRVLDTDPVTGAWLIKCSFMCGETDLTDEAQLYTTTINSQDMMIKTLKGEIAGLHEKLARAKYMSQLEFAENMKPIERVVKAMKPLDPSNPMTPHSIDDDTPGDNE